MAPQVETDPIPHVIMDVRNPDEVAYSPLPEALMGGVNIPGTPLSLGLPLLLGPFVILGLLCHMSAP